MATNNEAGQGKREAGHRDDEVRYFPFGRTRSMGTFGGGLG